MPDFIKPEFFDVFGIFIFAFFICISFWELKFNKPLPRWISIIILIIGILGLIVDGLNVYRGYFF